MARMPTAAAWPIVAWSSTNTSPRLRQRPRGRKTEQPRAPDDDVGVLGDHGVDLTGRRACETPPHDQ